MALVLLCYFSLNLVALFFVTVPLPLGRALSALVYLPTVFRHDPMLFVVGCIFFAQVCSGFYQRIPNWETCKEAWAAFMGLSVSVVLQCKNCCGVYSFDLFQYFDPYCPVYIFFQLGLWYYIWWRRICACRSCSLVSPPSP